MNGFQNGNSHTHDKPFPGCLGRMVNLFDLNSGVAGNKLLTDKPHGDNDLLCYIFFYIMFRHFFLNALLRTTLTRNSGLMIKSDY